MGGPKSLQDWIKYLHTAAQVPKDSPDYGEARQAMQFAIQHIHNLQVAAGTQEAQGEAVQQALEAQTPVLGSPLPIPQGVLAAFLHGAGLGTGELAAGVGSALAGRGFGSGAQAYREGLSNIETALPVAAPVAELAGSLAIPAPQARGLLSLKAGVPLTLGEGAARFARGGLLGAVPAAVSGFASGGEDPSDLAARVAAAKTGAELGGLLGLFGTGAGLKLARSHVERMADLQNVGTMRALQEARLRRLTAQEPLVPGRPPLTGDPLDDIAEALADFKAGRISQQDLNTAMEMAGRPGPPPPVAPKPVEPIAGSGGYGFTAVGPPTPPISTAPTIREMQMGLIGPKAAPAAQAGLLGSPFAQTAAEAGETAASKSAAVRAREAARTAYNVAIAGGQEPAQALEASRRAAAMSGGPPAVPRAIGPGMPLAQLKLLLTLPPEEFEAAGAMFPEAILQELRALRAQGATP